MLPRKRRRLRASGALARRGSLGSFRRKSLRKEGRLGIIFVTEHFQQKNTIKRNGTMAKLSDMKKEQERDELHRAIWAIADELRGVQVLREEIDKIIAEIDLSVGRQEVGA